MNDLEVFAEIEKMGNNAGVYRPHKALLLLAVADLFEQSKLNTSCVFYNEELKSAFSKRFQQFASADDRNRPYAPFFYLKSQSFWSLVPKPGKAEVLSVTHSIGGLGQLNELVNCAVLSSYMLGLMQDPIRRKKLTEFLMRILPTKEIDKTLSTALKEHHIKCWCSENPFVSYVNSFQNLDGNSDGALAERQATEAYFCQIHVTHPLEDILWETLTKQGKNKHIILTGHAGDGKSTIVLALYKRLKGLSPTKPLDEPIHKRESFNYGGLQITLIKDLSEWNDKEQDTIWADIKENKQRYVLVSNSGTLLSVFRRNSPHNEEMLWEEKVLSAMDSTRESSLEMGDICFCVYNLALRNNLDIGMQVWQKMCNADAWGKCEECPVHATCPIFKNISLIQQHNEVISTRLRLLLLRIFEYGNRLTMRQLSALFAYMLCSGYNCTQIRQLAVAGTHINFGDYLFFNHFFGENGRGTDIRSAQLKAITIIREQGFELRMAPVFERYLWLKDQKGILSLNIPELKNYYEKTLKTACAENSPDMSLEQSVAAIARHQIRRMFFFLYTPPEGEEKAFNKYLGDFLNSEMLLPYEQWKEDQNTFFEKRSKLQGYLFQVLQEHFSGVRIPDGSKLAGKELYITLARKQHNIRQSAQIVLGKINFNDNFTLKIEDNILTLVGKASCKGVNLELTLPFLDYISYRKNGGVGSILQRLYMDRLDKFKMEILEHCALSNDDGLVLLKQGNKYELLQQRIRMVYGRLEVSND